MWTAWGFNQAYSILIKWHHPARAGLAAVCGLQYYRVRSTSTPRQNRLRQPAGRRKGHNSQHRGKLGSATASGVHRKKPASIWSVNCERAPRSPAKSGRIIADIQNHLPDASCGGQCACEPTASILVTGESVKAAMEAALISSSPTGDAPRYFDRSAGHRPWKRKLIEFNSCVYQPGGWRAAWPLCRRCGSPRKQERPSGQAQQCMLFEDGQLLVSDLLHESAGKAHDVVIQYDQRADVENLVGEATA